MYVIKKPCTLSGTGYRIGDTIPTDKVDPNRAERLIRYGIIAEAAEMPSTPALNEVQGNTGTNAENGSQGILDNDRGKRATGVKRGTTKRR